MEQVERDEPQITYVRLCNTCALINYVRGGIGEFATRQEASAALFQCLDCGSTDVPQVVRMRKERLDSPSRAT